MLRLVCIAISVLLLADADIPQVFRLRPQPGSQVDFLPGQSLPVLPELSAPGDDQKPAKQAERLRPESRLELVRFVSGEFARAIKPLPAGKKGFHIKIGEAVDERALRQAVANNGLAASTGDTVQITRLEFRDREIVVDINGGGRKKTRWRDRIQIQAGGTIPTVTTSGPHPQGYQAVGATLYLDFGRSLPDMTPDELKRYLSAMLDFSNQRSAAVQWVETLPPEFRKAIEEKRPMVGMDRDMVIAAMGKPERKVRERTLDGLETEDWIYGQPPAKTVFVRFAGDRVIGVKQYP